MTTRHHTRRPRASQHRPVCPTCGAKPSDEAIAARMREELQTAWWSTTDQTPGRVTETRHCGHCQPHTVHIVASVRSQVVDGDTSNGELIPALHRNLR